MFSPISYHQAQITKNRKCTEYDLKMTLNATRLKVPYICWTTNHESQISLRFTLRSLIFQLIEVFYFSIGYNVNLKFSKKKNVKNRKLKISKIPNVFLRTIEKKNSGQVWKLLAVICRGSSSSTFALLFGPMLTKTKHKSLNFNLQNCKNPKHSFVRTTGTKIHDKFENFWL